MLLIARVTRRGLHDWTFDDAIGTIERERGHRNALVRTPGGQIFHIHDRQFFDLTSGSQLPRLHSNRKGPRRFPRRDGGLVVVDSRDATPEHGQHSEAKRWMLATDFRFAVGKSFAATGYIIQSINASSALTSLVLDLIDDTYNPDGRSLELRLDQLRMRYGIHPGYLQLLIAYYLHGFSESEAYQRLTWP